jgi:CMP-N,N'-diacetyllegionaminic acid synthase
MAEAAHPPVAAPRVLGLVTARGGSRGIPGKNIRPLGGRPLIAWTLDSAAASGAFERIVVSTDDQAIAEVARAHGGDVPFLRPPELALDTTPHLPVVQHAVAWLAEHQGYRPDLVMILQPTAPFRRPRDIRAAVSLLVERRADSVMSVVPVDPHWHPLLAFQLDERGGLRLYVSGEPVYRRVQRRQDLPPAFMKAGVIYLLRTELLFDPERPSLYGELTVPHVIEDQRYALDIDSPDDWSRAEALADILNLGT